MVLQIKANNVYSPVLVNWPRYRVERSVVRNVAEPFRNVTKGHNNHYMCILSYRKSFVNTNFFVPFQPPNRWPTHSTHTGG